VRGAVEVEAEAVEEEAGSGAGTAVDEEDCSQLEDCSLACDDMFGFEAVSLAALDSFWSMRRSRACPSLTEVDHHELCSSKFPTLAALGRGA
jgi:hypothetical protein